MDGQLTSLSEFRFDSLRKFMQPIYSELHRHAQDTKEEKQEILRSLVPQFFRRLRIYRESSIAAVADRARLTVEEVERFESGNFKATPAIEFAYCQACFGQQERDFFGRRIYEFAHPTVRASREAIAMDALKRFGVVMPDVDYSTLNSEKGKLLSFSRR